MPRALHRKVSAVVYFEDVSTSARLPELEHRPGNVQLFRFSAVTWNAHRIHYDAEYARSEGYPDILVQSHLHGCFLAQAALAWTGGSGVLRSFRWENRHYAVPGDVLRCRGVITGKRDTGDRAGLVDLELTEVNQDGRVCAPAWATVELPCRPSVREGR
jgi:hydroxyacyl-ACP dehydratase HTD2-like protein with hotdog domain